MTGIVIRKAERHQARLRLGLCGPSGSGKTYSALRLAKGLVAGTEGKIGLIDTERKSASLYAHLADFDVVELEPPYSPERYREAIHALERHVGPDGVIVIDQISHAWAGEGGLLEYVDTLKAQSRNSFSPWQKATPEQNRLVDTMLRSPCHVIATMRAKSEWVLEEQIVDGRKRNVPRKIGMAPVQRDGIEYEFTTMLDLENGSNTATASKDRSSLFAGITTKLDEEWGAKLRAWLTSGAAPEPQPEQPAAGGEPTGAPADPEADAIEKQVADWCAALESAETLDKLKEQYGLAKVALEGKASALQTEAVVKAKNKRARQLVGKPAPAAHQEAA
jgi:energy-coupling factor transporter ATP-binding protein EcfA2